MIARKKATSFSRKTAALIAIIFTMALFWYHKANAHEIVTVPVQERGRIVIFESGKMMCALYVNEEGTTHGTATMACVSSISFDSYTPTRIIDVLPTDKAN